MELDVIDGDGFLLLDALQVQIRNATCFLNVLLLKDVWVGLNESIVDVIHGVDGELGMRHSLGVVSEIVQTTHCIGMLVGQKDGLEVVYIVFGKDLDGVVPPQLSTVQNNKGNNRIIES